MPCVRKEFGLTFSTIDGKEFIWKVVLVYFTDRNDDFARLYIELAAPESFVQPELFQSDLSASLYLCLVLSAFVGIDFDCRFGSSMFSRKAPYFS